METFELLGSLSSEPLVIVFTFVCLILINTVQYFTLHGSANQVMNILARRFSSIQRISGKEPPANQWIQAARASMPVQIVFSAVGTLCLWLIFSERSQVYSDPAKFGWTYLIVSTIGALFVHDLYFYLCHLALHRNQWMYRHWHALHHQFREPTTYADHALHPMEALMSAAIFPILMMAIPLHFSVYIVMYLLTAVANIVGHTGREFFPKWMLVHPLLSWLNFTGFHNFHHTHNGGNFGYYTKIWDRLFATTIPAYDRWYSAIAESVKSQSSNHNTSRSIGGMIMRSLSTLIIIGLVVSGCTTERETVKPGQGAQQIEKPKVQEKSEKTSENEKTDETEKVGSIESQELCDKLRKDSVLVRSWKTEVDQLCAKLAELRQEKRVYRGNGVSTAYIDQSERVAGVVDISRVHLYSSLRQTNGPRYFFEKVKLEVSDPDAFKSKGFEMTPDERDIQFAVLQLDPKFTRYEYLNTAEVDVAIEYEGQSSFYEVVKDDTYVVVSRAVKTLQTIEEFTGLIVIHRIAGTQDIEVFALTIESYRNFGNHNQLVSKLQKKFEDEQTRGFRNGMHAGKIKLGDQ